MGQTENVEKAPKTSWFDGVKAEFKRSSGRNRNQLSDRPLQ